MQATTSAPPRGRATDRKLLTISLGLGAAAALLTLFVLGGATKGQSGSGLVVPMQSVVVAKDAIDPGKKITPSMVELKAIPEAAVPSNALTQIEKVVERTVRYPVAKGEPITEMRLVSTRTGDALSFTVPAGTRAFTIPINSTRSPAALLTPGDYVDVIAIMAGDRTATVVGPDTAVLALENPVQVLSVQRNYIEKGEPYETSDRGALPKDPGVGYLTLAVTPEEAIRLAWVADQAKTLTVALRGFGDERTKVNLAPFSGPIVPR